MEKRSAGTGIQHEWSLFLEDVNRDNFPILWWSSKQGREEKQKETTLQWVLWQWWEWATKSPVMLTNRFSLNQTKHLKQHIQPVIMGQRVGSLFANYSKGDKHALRWENTKDRTESPSLVC